MKVVVNRCWGGFGLSHEAVMRYAKLSGFNLYPCVDARDSFMNIEIPNRYEPYDPSKHTDPFLIYYYKEPIGEDGRPKEGSYFSESDLERNDPILVKVVEELGATSFGNYANLEVVEIPDGIDWEIEEYDGSEWVSEKHRTW